jgi:hypothetical protein
VLKSPPKATEQKASLTYGVLLRHLWLWSRKKDDEGEGYASGEKNIELRKRA